LLAGTNALNPNLGAANLSAGHTSGGGN